MVKSHQPPVFIMTNIITNGKTKVFAEIPPQIPPRTKKSKGPALPEKPAHMRPRPDASSRTQVISQRVLPSGHVFEETREVLRVLQSGQLEGREVLVAASKAGRERPIERRQRQPAQLITPLKSSPAPSSQKERMDMKGGPKRPPPVLLIPRGMLPPVISYALWAPQREVPIRRQMPRQQLKPDSAIRSSSVTRSGSLTSQGSSDSETFPKSVLKKQKRTPAPNNPTRASCREQKKNVTFNAFATVQLVEG